MGAVTALAAMHLNAAQNLNAPSYILALVGLAVLATYMSGFRLPNSPLLLWPVRIVLFAMVISASNVKYREGMVMALDPAYILLFGYLCAVELAVQCWVRHKTGSPRGEVMLLSALIMAVATGSTLQIVLWGRGMPPTAWLAPAFAFFMALSFRDFGPRRPTPEQVMAQVRAAAPRWAMIGVAIVLGAGVARSVRYYADHVSRHWLRDRLGGRTDIGSSGSMRLSSSSNPGASTVRVLLVDGLSGEEHLRGICFDTYFGGEWTPQYGERRWERTSPESVGSAVVGGRMRFTRLVDDSQRLLHAPLNCAGVAPEPGGIVEWDTVHGRGLRGWIEGQDAYAYEVVLSPKAQHQGPLCTPGRELDHVLLLAVSPQVHAVVRELGSRFAKLPTARDRAEAVTSYLQKNHRYSLTVTLGPGDPISDFIINKRDGHCQFFASAAAMLLRCAGVPSRVVVGYYAHEAAGRNTVVVRQRDAHAWCEYWDDAVGWVTLDATPGTGRPDQAYPPVGWWQRFRERLGDLWRAFREWLSSLSLMQIMRYLSVISLGMLAILAVRKLTRRPPRPAAAAEYRYPTPDLAAISARFQRLLSMHEMAPEPNRTWGQHLAALGARASRRHSPAPTKATDQRPAAPRLDLDALGRFIEQYNAARFGRACDPEAIAALQQALWTLEAASGSG